MVRPIEKFEGSRVRFNVTQRQREKRKHVQIIIVQYSYCVIAYSIRRMNAFDLCFYVFVFNELNAQCLHWSRMVPVSWVFKSNI